MKHTAEKIYLAVSTLLTLAVIVLWTLCVVWLVSAGGNVFGVKNPLAFFACMAIGGIFCICASIFWWLYFKRKEERARYERAKRCGSCGATIYTQASFCPRCGTPL